MSGTLAEWLVKPFFLGLSSGVYCLAACLPFLAPYLLLEKRTWRESGGIVLRVLAGRLTGYLGVGALCGWLGAFAGPRELERWTSVPLFILACGLIYFSVSGRGKSGGVCAASSGAAKAAPFWLGLLMGLNPCPPLLLAAGSALSLGSAFYGAVFFLVFFAGTAVHLLPVYLMGALSAVRAMRIAARVSGVAVGVLFLAHCGRVFLR